MKKSYNLIKALNKPVLYEFKGTYKKIDEAHHCPISSPLQKVDEPNRYGEKVWMREQIENYVKSIRLSRQEFFKVNSIDSGIFDSSTYSKSTTSSNRASIPVDYFRSIWEPEEKIDNIEEELPKNDMLIGA